MDIPIPEDDADRVAALRACGILDSAPEQAFDPAARGTAAGVHRPANLINSVRINILLAVFNMMPVPPLDGGRVAVGLLPRQLAMPLARVERFGILLVLGTFFLLPYIGTRIGVRIDPFGWLIAGPARFVGEIILTVTGHR